MYNSGKGLNRIAHIQFDFPYAGVLIGGAIDKGLTEKYGPAETGMGMMGWKEDHSQMIATCLPHKEGFPFPGQDTCQLDAKDNEAYLLDQQALADREQEKINSEAVVPKF